MQQLLEAHETSRAAAARGSAGWRSAADTLAKLRSTQPALPPWRDASSTSYREAPPVACRVRPLSPPRPGQNPGAYAEDAAALRCRRSVAGSGASNRFPLAGGPTRAAAQVATGELRPEHSDRVGFLEERCPEFAEVVVDGHSRCQYRNDRLDMPSRIDRAVMNSHMVDLESVRAKTRYVFVAIAATVPSEHSLRDFFRAHIRLMEQPSATPSNRHPIAVSQGPPPTPLCACDCLQGCVWRFLSFGEKSVRQVVFRGRQERSRLYVLFSTALLKTHLAPN